MSMRLLSGLLKRFVEKGQLTVIDTAGLSHVFGSGKDGPAVTVRIKDDSVARAIFFNPELAFPEAYMDDRIAFEGGSSVYDLLMLFSVNRKALGGHPIQQALRNGWRAVRRWQQQNSVAQASRNIRHHYDISPAFYKLWLDPTMNYSCAYYTHPENSLEQAQMDKMRHIAAKLRLQPGMTVAEVGSGWGASPAISRRTSESRCGPSPSRRSRSPWRSSGRSTRAWRIGSSSSSRITATWRAPTTGSSPSP